MRSIKIDRLTWLRGQDGSQLYRDEDKLMCCIGQALNQCGVPIDTLKGHGTVNDLIGIIVENEEAPKDIVPTEFLDENDEAHDCNCDHCESRTAKFEEVDLLGAMYSINDDKNTDDAFKESQLVPMFARIGLEAEFIN